MAVLKVERLGGLAGMGLTGSHLRSRGEIDPAHLSLVDRKRVDVLFAGAGQGAAASPVRDGFTYRLTRSTAAGEESVEVAETALPASIAASVRDELI